MPRCPVQIVCADADGNVEGEMTIFPRVVHIDVPPFRPWSLVFDRDSREAMGRRETSSRILGGREVKTEAGTGLS